MPRGKRVVLLGATGLRKREVAERLAHWTERDLGHRFRIIDFEKEYLTNRQKRRQPLPSFLAMSVAQQHDEWQKAWADLEQDGLTDEASENRILLVHASIVRGDYGVRCACQADRIATYAPETIVTLIDDVHNLWWQTEARAHGEYHRGRPTLEQLIMARRCEQLIGDVISLQTRPPARHLVLAALHPVSTLGNYIFTGSKLVYLSFPITRPREMQQQGDPRGVDAVNGFLERAYDVQRSSRGSVFVNPLSIDELQLGQAFSDEDCQTTVIEDGKEVEAVRFDLAERWNLDHLWERDDCLSPGPIPEENRNPLFKWQLEDALGLIRSDVGWRDFRLVMQADALAVFSPVMARGRLSRGVKAEIRAACAQMTPVYVYQDPALDTEGKFLEWFGTAGTMAADVAQQWVTPVNSLNELFQRITG